MTEGRTLVLTGPQMLELAGLCRDALELWTHARTPGAGMMRLRARWWVEHLESEHTAHLGEQVKIPTAAFRCPACGFAWIVEKTETFSEADYIKCQCGATSQIVELTRGAVPASWEGE